MRIWGVHKTFGGESRGTSEIMGYFVTMESAIKAANAFRPSAPDWTYSPDGSTAEVEIPANRGCILMIKPVEVRE